MTRTHDKGDNRQTILILAAVLVALAAAALTVLFFGLPMLGIIGLVLTVAVFAVMLLFTSGN
ncbi:hypothetical protein EYE42_09630 [Paracoccus subflavus]|uniref:Uncharacterized protein n=1 Tax=Paracoccus subflavus TaxID=2528244 RepID=A0A4V2JC78_9RHOB|nr:hypothetical protein [Paracoccus subflavus]TBN39910.1 hypothetical protein EYE42_09630 [Paracoccus subflavus]